jgi:hypothetical protein
LALSDHGELYPLKERQGGLLTRTLEKVLTGKRVFGSCSISFLPMDCDGLISVFEFDLGMMKRLWNLNLGKSIFLDRNLYSEEQMNPSFCTLRVRSFKTLGVVMNVFLLDPEAPLVAGFVWTCRSNSSLYVAFDWDKEEYYLCATEVSSIRGTPWHGTGSSGHTIDSPLYRRLIEQLVLYRL